MRGLLRRAEKEVETSKNARLPAVRLPPEVLQYIFRLASLQAKDVSRSPSCIRIATGDIWSFVEPVPTKVAILASVCRRWRSVALADSALWNTISDRRDRRPLVVSQGSRSAALELRLLASPSYQLRALLQSEGHRVRAIEWDKANARREDLALLATPACRLEKLVLGMNPHLPYIDTHTLTAWLAPQAPSLRQLTLRDCASVSGCAFPRLTGLHLDACPSLFDCDDLLGLLARAPNLTDLVLSRLHLDMVEGALAPVMLPRLRRLVFADTVRGNVGRFLTRIALPTTASIRIHAFESSAPSDALDAEWLSSLAKTPALGNAAELFVAEHSDTFVAGPAAAVCFVQEDKAQPHAQRRVSAQTPAWDARAVLSHVLALAPIRKAWLLAEDGIAGISSLPPSVDTVVVQDTGLTALLGVLDRKAQATPSEGEGVSISGATDTHARGPLGLTVQVLMTRFVSVDVVLGKVAQRADARNMHVAIGCLPSYMGDRTCPAGFGDAFASLRFEAYQDLPAMVLPDVCMERAHCLWPAWVE